MLSPFWTLIVGLILGIGIGADCMWIYMMRKYAGRPVEWRTLGVSLAVTAGTYALWLMLRG